MGAFDFTLARTLGEAAIAAGAGSSTPCSWWPRPTASSATARRPSARLAALQQSAAGDEQLGGGVAARTENLVLRLADATRAAGGRRRRPRAAIADERAVRDDLAVKRALVLHSAGNPLAALEILLPRLDHLEGDEPPLGVLRGGHRGQHSPASSRWPTTPASGATTAKVEPRVAAGTRPSSTSTGALLIARIR